MAVLVGSGAWTQGNKPNTSMHDRDFFSGDLTIANAAYADAQEYVFGFAAPEVVITNTSTNRLVFQWLSRKGTVIDSGVVGGNSVLKFQAANKSGIRLRSDGGSVTCNVMAVG